MRPAVIVVAVTFLLSSNLPGQAAPPVVTKLRTIGCESCGDATQFSSIWDVSLSSKGQILVTDKNAPMLRLFDQSGRVLWTGGQRGKGPGEFVLPFRSTMTDHGITVVDMTNARITDLSGSGGLVGSIPMLQFATTAGANPRGDLVLGMDNFGRSFIVKRRPPKGSTMETVAEFPGSMKNKSIAVAPDGSVAVALDGEKYEIIRLDAAGKTTDTIVRAIERPRRTAVEEAEHRERLNRGLAMMSAEMKKAGASGKVSAPDIPPEQRGLKPHLATDGLRFDGSNRLWVRTMRGNEATTVFDVMSTAGDFIGSVTVPMRVASYALAGTWLVTAGEDDGGVPVVVIWTVK